jgi:hypothetical protein
MISSADVLPQFALLKAFASLVEGASIFLFELFGICRLLKPVDD